MVKIKPVSISQLRACLSHSAPELHLLINYSATAYTSAQSYVSANYTIAHPRLISLASSVAFHANSIMLALSVAVSRCDLVKVAWVLSHCMTVLGTTIFLYSGYNVFNSSKDFQVWVLQPHNAYIVALWGAISTYSLVTYKYLSFVASPASSPGTSVEAPDNNHHRASDPDASQKQELQPAHLTNMENTQLLAIALLTYHSADRPSFLKLGPFFIYSIMNLFNYLLTDLFSNTSFAPTLLPFSNYVEEPLLMLACYFDLATLLLCSLEAIITHEFTPLMLHTLLYCSRWENSYPSRTTFHLVISHVSKLLRACHAPLFLVTAWHRLQQRLLKVIPIPVTRTVGNSQQKEPLGRHERSFPRQLHRQRNGSFRPSFSNMNQSLATSQQEKRITSLVFDNFPVINDVL